ncbi:MAG: hypothetical protein ACYC49_11540, partial [Ignavibacteriaceae bacterium]
MMYYISIIVTLFIFGLLGYELSVKYSLKLSYTKNLMIFVFILLSFLFYGIGKDIRLFSFFNFSIMLNRVLGSLILGFTVGLFVLRI